MTDEAASESQIQAKLTAHYDKYAPLNALGRPKESACRCTTWPCPCACHARPKGP
jgi:hypothetical protein